MLVALRGRTVVQVIESFEAEEEWLRHVEQTFEGYLNPIEFELRSKNQQFVA